MKAFPLMALLVISLLPSSLVVGQTAGSLAQAAQANPQGMFPGFIVRFYNLDKAKGLTSVLAVVQAGSELKTTYFQKAEDALRGDYKELNLGGLANGYIVLDKDTNVNFIVEGNDLTVNREDYGRGTYTKAMPKGKYPIEVARAHGKGQGNFQITDQATGKSVVFYTGEMLNIDLSKSFKDGKLMQKSALLNDAP